MKEKDIQNVVNMAKSLNINGGSIEKLKDEASKKGVMEKAQDMQKEYAPKFQEFLNSNGDLKNLSNEEKASVIMEYKEKLSLEEQKQFDKVLSMLKTYVKKSK